MKLLTDDDVRSLLSPGMALAAMERAFRLQAQGALAAPPRSSVPSAGGRLVLTVGGAMDAHGATGFRAYHTAEDAAEQRFSGANSARIVLRWWGERLA